MGPKQSTTHVHSQEITPEDFRDVVCFLRLVEITETEFISTTQKKEKKIF